MAEDKKVTTRNIKADAQNCVDGAREMRIPIKTALDVFQGEPVALLLGMTKRVQELRIENADAPEDDFDPVRYVTQAAENRGWGKYRKQEEITITDQEVEDTVPHDAVEIDLAEVDDDKLHDRIMTLVENHPDWVIRYLAVAIEQAGWASHLDREEKDPSYSPPPEVFAGASTQTTEQENDGATED